MPDDTEVNEADGNVRLFQRYVALQNARNYDELRELIADEFINHTYFGGTPVSAEAHIRALKGYFGVFPDDHTTIDEILADGDWVVGRTTNRGTMQRDFVGTRANGQQMATPLIHAIRVVDGRIVEYRSTNPFEPPIQTDMAAAVDVQHARARQGRSFAGVLPGLRQLLDAAEEQDLLDRGEREHLRGRVESHANQCQALLAENMRRCMREAETDSLYCGYHQEQGFGVE